MSARSGLPPVNTILTTIAVNLAFEGCCLSVRPVGVQEKKAWAGIENVAGPANPGLLDPVQHDSSVKHAALVLAQDDVCGEFHLNLWLA